MEEAGKLLEESTVNVKEIGKAVGYADSNYFAKVFKRTNGTESHRISYGYFSKDVRMECFLHRKRRNTLLAVSAAERIPSFLKTAMRF